MVGGLWKVFILQTVESSCSNIALNTEVFLCVRHLPLSMSVKRNSEVTFRHSTQQPLPSSKFSPNGGRKKEFSVNT